MENNFANYETSKKLKELGFDGKCLAFYSNANLIIQECSKKDMQPHWEVTFAAPLWQQVRQWIWDNHKAFIRLEFDYDGYYVASFLNEDGDWNFVLNNKKVHDYIEAENDAIKDAVEWLHKNVEK